MKEGGRVGEMRRLKENRDTETHVGTNRWTFFCAYMNQVVIQQRRGVEGVIFIRCIV